MRTLRGRAIDASGKTIEKSTKILRKKFVEAIEEGSNPVDGLLVPWVAYGKKVQVPADKKLRS